jgi:hypothetical protein
MLENFFGEVNRRSCVNFPHSKEKRDSLSGVVAWLALGILNGRKVRRTPVCICNVRRTDLALSHTPIEEEALGSWST